MLNQLLYISIGAAAGALLRYAAILFLPAPILWANIVGSLLIGFFSVKFSDSTQILLLVCLGFLGSLTTFSSFALELVNDLQNGAIVKAICYALGSVLLCVGACYLGIKLAS